MRAGSIRTAPGRRQIHQQAQPLLEGANHVQPRASSKMPARRALASRDCRRHRTGSLVPRHLAYAPAQADPRATGSLRSAQHEGRDRQTAGGWCPESCAIRSSLAVRQVARKGAEPKLVLELGKPEGPRTFAEMANTDQGIIARELVRQALLIAAPMSWGWPPATRCWANRSHPDSRPGPSRSDRSGGLTDQARSSSAAARPRRPKLSSNTSPGRCPTRSASWR